MAEKSECGAHVFLFDADAPELNGIYGYACGKALFDAALQQCALQSPCRIYSGDLLLHFLCERMREAARVGGQTSITYTVEDDLYFTLLTELSQSIKAGYSTVPPQQLPMLFAKHSVYCITLTHLPYAARDAVDAAVRNAAGYMGAVEIDWGNPLHVELFMNRLIDHGFLHHNILYIQEEAGVDDDELIPDWARERPGLEVKMLSYEVFAGQAPKRPVPKELSVYGKRFQNSMTTKGREDHYQKIAAGLLANEENDFQFRINGKLSFQNILVPKEKLTDYVLNLEHESGRAKAQLIKDLLGITKEDWRYLAAQIENGLPEGTLCNVRKTQYGIQYHIDIPVVGLNGASKTMRTAWITKDDVTIALTTAYIAAEKDQQGIQGEEPLIVPGAGKGNFWEVLYNFARNEAGKAAAKAVPTPLYITGYPEPFMEGLCGFAYVVVKDARRGFAKWLKDNNIGIHCYKGGWRISAPTPGQSYEKAKAYAETFAKILRQNGVSCYAEARLD